MDNFKCDSREKKRPTVRSNVGLRFENRFFRLKTFFSETFPGPFQISSGRPRRSEVRPSNGPRIRLCGAKIKIPKNVGHSNAVPPLDAFSSTTSTCAPLRPARRTGTSTHVSSAGATSIKRARTVHVATCQRVLTTGNRLLVERRFSRPPKRQTFQLIARETILANSRFLSGRGGGGESRK